MIRPSSAILAIVLSAAFTCAAVTSSRWEHVPAKDHARSNPFASTHDAVAAGSLIYADHCLQCHKAGGQGDGHKRPSLRSDRIRTASDGDIEWFLRQGDIAHGMPSWSSIPEAQRWQLVTYLKSIQ